MSFDTIRRRVNSADQARQFLDHVMPSMARALDSGQHLYIEIREATRNLDQNAKFHAICGGVAKSGTTWAGKPRTKTQWKCLLVSGHAIATDEPTDIVLGLEGEFINLRESTASMSIRRASSLIEYSLAWCAQTGIYIAQTSRELSY